MSKYTPGPWHIATDDSLDTSWLWGDTIANSNDDAVACIWIGCGWHLQDGEAEANARLISAAPDLLGLAYSVLWFANQYPAQVTFAMRGLVDDAKALIAKVDGDEV